MTQGADAYALGGDHSEDTALGLRVAAPERGDDERVLEPRNFEPYVKLRV
jgi:hypothetical protein